MYLVVPLPQMGELMTAGTIRRVHVSVGQEIGLGTPLFDALVDLSHGAAQDCPPVFHLRAISRERGWIRELHAEPGTELAIGAPVMTVTTIPDEPLAGATRSLRVTAITINLDPVFDLE